MTHRNTSCDTRMRPALAHVRALCICGLLMLAGAVQAGAPPDQGAAGIVHSVPVAPVAPQPAVRPFTEYAGITPASISSETARCSLDVLDGEPARAAMVIDHRVPVTFVGWAGDDRSGVPPALVFLLIGKKTFGVAGEAGLPRRDVAAAKHNPALGLSGFSISGDPRAIPQGEYRAALVERFGTQDRLCLFAHTIAVK